MASCFCSICKFGSLKNTFATITSQSELHFRFRRFILLVQTKKMISMNYGSSRNCWKPWTWVRFGLILRWGVYTSIHAWTPSQYLLAPAKVLSLKTSPQWNISQKIRKTICNKTGHPVLSLLESQWKPRQHDWNFSMEGKPL